MSVLSLCESRSEEPKVISAKLSWVCRRSDSAVVRKAGLTRQVSGRASWVATGPHGEA
jgi:hypothetical protein